MPVNPSRFVKSWKKANPIISPVPYATRSDQSLSAVRLTRLGSGTLYAQANAGPPFQEGQLTRKDTRTSIHTIGMEACVSDLPSTGI